MRPNFIAVAVASLVLVACHGGKKASLPQDASASGVIGGIVPSCGSTSRRKVLIPAGAT